MQTQGVQESRQSLHDEQDGDSEGGEGREDYRQPKEPTPAPGGQTQVHHHGPKHLWQFCTHNYDTIITEHRYSAQDKLSIHKVMIHTVPLATAAQ